MTNLKKLLTYEAKLTKLGLNQLREALLEFDKLFQSEENTDENSAVSEKDLIHIENQIGQAQKQFEHLLKLTNTEEQKQIFDRNHLIHKEFDEIHEKMENLKTAVGEKNLTTVNSLKQELDSKMDQTAKTILEILGLEKELFDQDNNREAA